MIDNLNQPASTTLNTNVTGSSPSQFQKFDRKKRLQ